MVKVTGSLVRHATPPGAYSCTQTQQENFFILEVSLEFVTKLPDWLHWSGSGGIEGQIAGRTYGTDGMLFLNMLIF